MAGRWAWVGLVVWLVGCGGEPVPPTRACAPGATQACVCSNGMSGAQTCNSSGSTFGGCMCASGCSPNCAGRECGPDGCPGSGTCGTVSCGSQGMVCDESAGQCVSMNACTPGAVLACTCSTGAGTRTCASDGSAYGACACPMPTVDAGTPDVPVANCTGRECGPNGIGGTCGTCPLTGWTCNGLGRCVSPDMTCRSACGSRVCGPDTGMYCDGRMCGPNGGACTGASVCTAAGTCVCTPQCSGRVCGSNGCGGQCGACPLGSDCNASGQCASTGVCVSACGGRMCGPDTGVNCTGRTCGACPSGYVCNGSGTGCGLNPASRWVVTAVSGTVGASPPSGGSWDIDGSAPDAQLCLTINAEQRCTNIANDTYTPSWTMGVFPATTASALLSGIQSVYRDDDIGPDNDICLAGPVQFQAADFTVGGSRTFRCLPYGTFTLSLSPAP